MELNQKKEQSREEKNYSTNRNGNFGREIKKTLYVVNFTPVRLLIFSASCSALILFVFVLGFHLGSSKPSFANASNEVSTDNSGEILMRTSDDENVDSYAVNDVSISTENNYNNSSIIRESSSSEDRYNEYTQSLALELDSINENIKDKETSGISPNATYNPPEQFANSSVSVSEETSTVTKKPYTRTSSEDSIYFIQVAVGYSKENTYSARDSLKSKFPKAFIKEENDGDGRTMYKLKVGRYDSREDAQKALAEIKKIPAYRDSYIYSDRKVS